MWGRGGKAPLILNLGTSGQIHGPVPSEQTARWGPSDRLQVLEQYDMIYLLTAIGLSTGGSKKSLVLAGKRSTIPRLSQ